jgi:hypothetical protein
MSSVYMPLVRTRMIAPTRGYDKLPALSPLEAAEVIAYAIVTQKERVAPWWLGWVELASLLLRIPVGRIFRFLEQRHKG